MVKHVVMWTLNDISKAQEIKSAIESMKGRVKSLVDIESGINFNKEKADCDLVLISVHKTREDMDAYQIDPLHKEVAKLIGAAATSRHAVDFEF